MQNKIKILALFGKAGAGKDYLQKQLLLNDDRHNPKFHGIVSATTRPPRDNEIPGEDYIFLSNEEFAQNIINGSMLEATVFRDWCYGTLIESLKPGLINIGVFNITGIEALLKNDELIVQPVYIRALDKTRIIRQLQREGSPDIEEIFRRYKTDKEDFLDIPFSYKIVINDPTMTFLYDPVAELKDIAADLDKIV